MLFFIHTPRGPQTALIKIKPAEMEFYGSSGSQEWDANFSQVLNRTRDNISRISNRYSTQQPTSSARHIPTTPIAAAYQPSPSKGQSSHSSNMGGSSVTIDAGVLNNILDRLQVLESSSSSPLSVDSRVVGLENALEAMRRKLESTTLELQDSQRSSLQLGNQVTRQGGLLEVLQQDIDARRSVVSRMDSWARQGEIWRDDMEGQITALNRQIKDMNKHVADHRETISDSPSKGDMIQLKDRLTVMTQQTVAASLSVWHDKIEASVRQVERQVAAVRIGRTVGAGGKDGAVGSDMGAGMSDREVQEALSTKQPSELLLKSMIDSAMLDAERKMESTIEARIRSEMKGEHFDSMKALRDEMKNTVSRLAAEAGLIAGADDIDGKSAARQAVSSKRAQERELEAMSNKYGDVSAALVMLQESMDSSEKHRVQEYRTLERRVDETVAVSNSNVNAIQARCAGLEELVRSSELAQRSAMQVGREEAQERIREVASSWSGDRVALDRRLLVVEKTAEDLVERLKMSSSAIESFFNSSAEGRRLQASAARTELLQIDLQNLKTEGRDTLNALARLEAQAVTQSEYSELRDRLSRMEPMRDMIKRLETQATEEKDSSARFTNQLISLEQAVTSITSNTQTLTQRITTSETQSKSALSDAISLKETLSLTAMRLDQVDSSIRTLRTESEIQLSATSASASKVHEQLESSIKVLEGKVAAIAADIRSINSNSGSGSAGGNSGINSSKKTEIPPSSQNKPKTARTASPDKVIEVVDVLAKVVKSVPVVPMLSLSPTLSVPPVVQRSPSPTPKSELPKKPTSPKLVVDHVAVAESGAAHTDSGSGNSGKKTPPGKTLVGLFESSPVPVKNSSTKKPKSPPLSPVNTVNDSTLASAAVKVEVAAEKPVSSASSSRKTQSDSDDDYEFFDAKTPKALAERAALKAASDYVAAAENLNQSSEVADQSATSPFPGLNLSSMSVNSNSVSSDSFGTPLAKEKEMGPVKTKPNMAALKLPIKGLGLGSMAIDLSVGEDDPYASAPVSKRREEKSDDESTGSVAVGAAKLSVSASVSSSSTNTSAVTTPADKPGKPHKPSRVASPSLSASVPASPALSVPSSATKMSSESPPIKPEKNLSATERLALRREAIKKKKAADQLAEQHQRSAQKSKSAVASPGSVHSFEAYEDDSFEN